MIRKTCSAPEQRSSGGRLMWWLVWVGLGSLLLLLLAVSWWYDRDARRRGATPLSGRQMGRARRARDLRIQQEVSRTSPMGMTPRGNDAARDIWHGR
jgi:hypothetical protein